MVTSEQELLCQIEAYAKAAGMAESTFGRVAVNDGKLVESLRRGGTVTLKTLQKIQAYIATHPAPDPTPSESAA